ncbi:MAG: hypothetical protein H6724_15015 [Sandaracinus sp.]|nr:hypothetical protein [Sandaracinus sp.]MCB9620747.1 hypothetical protein [Sandaracinus sp.]MCB9624507.1 hypothetical protein [Sandaracinus sp.]
MIRVDDVAFPLVVVSLPSSWSEDEWESYLARMRTYPSRRERYVTLTDARGAGTPSAAQRKRAAQVMAEDEALSKRFNVANGLVFESALLRGMLTAITWLTPPPVPMQTFASPRQALEWLDGLYLSAQGTKLPSWGRFDGDR